MFRYTMANKVIRNIEAKLDVSKLDNNITGIIFLFSSS